MTQYLKTDQLDDVARAVLTLARELWVTRDRQRALEAVLESHGIPVEQSLRKFEPSAEMQKALEAERREFVRALVETLVPPSDTQ